MALAGVGIACLLEFMLREDLAAGNVIRPDAFYGPPICIPTCRT